VSNKLARCVTEGYRFLKEVVGELLNRENPNTVLASAVQIRTVACVGNRDNYQKEQLEF
jgi:hypothetical protein